MRIVIQDATGKKIGDKDITGSDWMALDNGFANDEIISLAIVLGKLPYVFFIKDDIDQSICKGDITGLDECDEYVTFERGKLEIQMIETSNAKV